MGEDSNGVFQLEGRVRFEDILDGLSNTLMVGEKHVPLGKFGVGWWDGSTYNGDYYVCSSRAAGRDYPLASSLNDPNWRFGSYHTAAICQFAFCDGSVHTLQSSIDPGTLSLLANRSDGCVIPDY